MAFALGTPEGADIGASESLSRSALLARLSDPNRIPCHVVRWLSPAKKGDVSTMEAKTPAKRALAVLDTPAPPAPIDPTGRRRLIPSG